MSVRGLGDLFSSKKLKYINIKYTYFYILYNHNRFELFISFKQLLSARHTNQLAMKMKKLLPVGILVCATVNIF